MGLNSEKPYCGMGNVENLVDYMSNSWAESIVVPNSLLTEDLHDNIRGGRTLGRLEKLLDKRDGVDSEYAKRKAIKARNIEQYAKQVAESSQFAKHGDFVDINREINYNLGKVDEIQLHKNMMAMVGGMISAGIIDSDDLIEE